MGLTVVAGLLIYGRTLWHPLIWDSEVLVKSVSVITSENPFAGIREPFLLAAAEDGGGSLETLSYWRPALAVALNLWRRVVGEHPMGWHGLALGLNALITALVFGLARSVGLARGSAFWVALLFAVNPGRVSMVAWVYSITNLAFVAAALAAFNAWVRGRFGLALAMLILALGTRETAVMLPVVFFAWDGVLRRRAWPGAWMVASVSTVGVYLVLRAVVVGGGPPVGSLPLLDWASAMAVITYRHLVSLIWPAWGVRFYPLSGAWEDPAILAVSVAVTAGIVATWIWTLRRHRWFAFWMTWCATWLAINFNVGEFGVFLMGEKNNGLLAVGMAFLVVGVAMAVSRRVSPLRLEAVGLIIVLAHAGLATWRAGHWSSREGYFRSAIAQAPEFGHLHYALGIHYVLMNQDAEAERAFQDAVRYWPELSLAWNNLGTARFLQGNLDGAGEAWREALARDPGNARAAYNLGLLAQRRGNADEAARYFEIHRRLTGGGP